MFRRLSGIAVCLLLVLSLGMTVRAETAASSIQNFCTVTADGDCRVSLTVTINLETPLETLTFPLPLEAENITRDGSGVNTRKTEVATEVDITNVVRGLTGQVTMRFDYTVPDVVTMVESETEPGTYVPTLELPLLCGFSYPVETMVFDVQFPSGAIITNPIFTSIYHQDGIESSLIFSRKDNTISGSLARSLKDFETLTMTMPVAAEAFPSVGIFMRTGNPEVIPMTVLAVLALVYWLVFLRGMPLLRSRRMIPPEGITAGELGSRLTFAGADLTMMVFSWAQLGYILIHLDDNGRVMLHKRMDMGNERSSFEVKTFQSLFGKHRVVDGTGFQYARLCRKVAQKVPGQRSMCKKGSGNRKIFRFLAAAIHFFCGICLAMNLTGMLMLQILLAIVLSIGGAISGWAIQGGISRLHLRFKLPLLVSLGLSVLWILLGVLAGQLVIGLLSVLSQLLAGLALAYGGRRSDLGRQNASQILGLRQYFRKADPEQIKQLCHNDPEYFFSLAPFAMALGVEKAFAKRFGRHKLPPCPYFVCGVHGRMDALDHARFMAEAAQILDERQRRMAWEKYAVIRFR